ncbi:hypothetical protein CSW41_08735 [Thermus scotoductus]|uniref:Uncharacterized protein n=1 Tax=Thermus scotoductus TaxID=37636 RepID=A0A430RKE4_THESC|nr:hypothetical protein [Thermus scotoductus]RTH16986.1 hypothetical protein CSW41_08735 [Thermus scotoductus]
MKGNRLRALLGYALLGGTALLFAGCGQQAGGGQGQEPPKPINISLSGVSNGQVVSGVVTVGVSVNEDSQPREVKLYVDDKLVGQYTIAPQGIRPQALSYEFKVNTAACDLAYLGREDSTGCTSSDPTPLFTNGSHTVKAEVTNPVETKTLSVTVVLNNSDKVLLTMSGNNAQDATGYTWYGGQDLTLEAVPVVYSGKTATAVRISDATPSPPTVIPGTTIPYTSTSIAGIPAENPISGGKATFSIPKSGNTSLEGGKRLAAQIRYSDGTLSGAVNADYALDFTAPSFSAYKIKLNGVYDTTVNGLLGSTSGWLNGQSPLSVTASDGGVGGITYQIQVQKVSDGSVVATLNPGDTLASVAEAATGTYRLQVVNLKDALGNAPASAPAASNNFGLDKTKPTLSTTFGANGKVLNGTLGAASTIPLKAQDPGANASGVPGTTPNGDAPSSSSLGTAGWILKVTKGGCTYKLANPTDFPAVGSSQVPYSLDMTLTGTGTATNCPNYTAPTSSGGDADYTVTLQLVDQARNVSDPVTVSFYWLTQKPTVQFLQSPGGTYSLGGSSYVDVNGAVKVSHPKPLLKAILYAEKALASSSDVQVINPSPTTNIANGTALTFSSNGSVTGNYKDFTASASNFAFTLRFNATGSYSVTIAAVPEAYDNTGTLNVANLSNSTSVSVTVSP